MELMGGFRLSYIPLMAVELARRPVARAPGKQGSEPSRWEVGAVGLLALATSAGYVAIAWAHGAIGASRNDDWAYYRVAYRLATHGAFALDGWVETMFISQALGAWPIIRVFGPKIAPLQITVAIIGAVGLWAAYLVIRSFLSRGWSAFAVGCLALGPLYGSLSMSFMTDVPSFAFQALTLLAGLRTLRSKAPSVPWFVTSLGLGVVAFGIREYGVAAGLAVCVLVHRRARVLDRLLARRLTAIAVGWVFLLVAFFLWRRGLSHSLNPQFDLSLSGFGDSVGTAWLAAVTLALFISPAVLAVSPFRLVTAVWTQARRPGVIVVCMFVAIAVAVVVIPRRAFLGNYFQRQGSYVGTTSGTHPPILASWIWDLLRLLGFSSLVAIGLLMVLRLAAKQDRPLIVPSEPTPRPSDGRALVGVFSALTVALALVAILTTNAPFYDRYLVALIPFAAALTIRTGLDQRLVHPVHAVAIATFASLSLVGLTLVDASATVDGAKWHLARAVERLGLEPATIDGGYEWFGYHQTDSVVQRPPIKGRPFWVTLFSERPVCATVTLQSSQSAGLPGTELQPQFIQHRTVHSLLGIDYHLAAIADPQHCDPTTQTKNK
jgi:hypothetical protein